MKRILFLSLLLVNILALAGNKITVSSSSGKPGEVVEFSVTLTNTDEVTAMELVIPLEGIASYVDGSAVLNDARSSSHSITAAETNKELRMYIYNMTLTPFKGNDGEICKFKLNLGKKPKTHTLNPAVILSDKNGVALTNEVVPGNVTVLSPEITLSTESIDFGRSAIRGSYTRTFQITNSGTQPLTISDVSSGNKDFVADFTQGVIEAGSSQTVTITYSPLERGTIKDALSITSDAINGKQTIELLAIPFSVNELHVTEVHGISDEEVTVVLNMNNMEPIVAAQCSFDLPKELIYVAGSALAGSRCTNHKVEGVVSGNKLTLYLYSVNNSAIPEGDSDLLSFKLKLDGRNGWYRLDPKNVILSNVGMENMTSATSGAYVVIKSPRLSCSDQLTFSDSPVTEKARAEFSLRNDGEVDMTFEKVTFLAEGYSVEEAFPIVIKPRETKSIHVLYTPTKQGDFSTTMQVYTNDPENRMKSVAVKGHIYEPNNMTLAGGASYKTGDYTLSFGLDNYTEVVALQMDVHWPASVTAATEDLKFSTRLTDHAKSVTEIEKGVYRVLIYSMANTPFLENKGELCQLVFHKVGETDYFGTEITVDNIVISTSDGKNCASTDVLKLAVNLQKATSLSFEKTSVNIDLETEIQLVPIVTPDNVTYKEYIWKSSNTKVATVVDGKVTGLANGFSEITATTVDGSELTAKCLILVGNDFLLGDVNLDGVVDIMDIIAVTSYILDNTKVPANLNAGDIDSDGIIDVMDIIGITKIILNS